MIVSTPYTSRLLYSSGLVTLIAGLLFGVLASLWYAIPDATAYFPRFEMLRPMHVSAVLFWILTGASGAVLMCLESLTGIKPIRSLLYLQLLCWWIAIAGVFYSYANGTYGGREYWEFPPLYSGFIAASWILFGVQVVRQVRRIRKWPVYVWMWMTGTCFFLFTFAESYLWLFPWFREHMVTDLTIQWKSSGSLVGSWNQLIYGTAFYLMDRISGNNFTGRSRIAFVMYFLGLFNLMFNWGHHLYPVPNPAYVRITGYAVSMTEWVFFIRILSTWKRTFRMDELRVRGMSYRFLIAAEFWVFLNLFQALVMSVPAWNLYTHGTHVTVAHAMGTTIGINTMILLGAGFELLGRNGNKRRNSRLLVAVQVSLFLFWMSLLVAGIIKGQWLNSAVRSPFSRMMESLHPFYISFAATGVLLCITLAAIAVVLLAGSRPPPKQKRTVQPVKHDQDQLVYA